MRVQLFGHPVARSIVILVGLEGIGVFCALILASLLRLHAYPHAVDYAEGSIWMRGLLFTGATLFCSMAFGLYSARQRARTIGILFRVLASVGGGVAVTAVGFYLIPHLWIG